MDSLHVNDATCVFFHALEIQTRKHLPQQLKSTIITGGVLIKSIAEDEDVLFFWAMISIDIKDHSDSKLLLYNSRIVDEDFP